MWYPTIIADKIWYLSKWIPFWRPPKWLNPPNIWSGSATVCCHMKPAGSSNVDAAVSEKKKSTDAWRYWQSISAIFRFSWKFRTRFKFQFSCTQRRRIETSGVAFEFAKFGLFQFWCSYFLEWEFMLAVSGFWMFSFFSLIFKIIQQIAFDEC